MASLKHAFLFQHCTNVKKAIFKHAFVRKKHFLWKIEAFVMVFFESFIVCCERAINTKNAKNRKIKSEGVI
jgi:hypothetical protein